VLERIGDAAGRAAAALITTEDFVRPVDVWLARHDPAYTGVRFRHYARPDANPALRVFMKLGRGEVVRRTQFMPDHEFEADPCFQALHVPQGFYYSCISTLRRSDSLLSAFGVYRGRRFGDFDSEEVALLERLVPHLAHALSVHRRMSAARVHQHRAEVALSLLNVAICLLTADGRIIFANRAAEDLLRRCDGLRLRRGQLAADDPAETGRLAGAIAGAAKEPRRVVALPLHREAGRRPLQVWAVPLPRQSSCSTFQAFRSDVMLLALDPEQSPAPPTNVLRALYTLTDAEAQLVLGLIAGERLADYAERAGITMNTAKSHLKAVFAKTDTNRQAELVRLLSLTVLRLAPADRQS
jgi:DNA-binding CsgD family transcriptional regulator/PAS domain-containing protein